MDLLIVATLNNYFRCIEHHGEDGAPLEQAICLQATHLAFWNVIQLLKATHGAWLCVLLQTDFFFNSGVHNKK